jgi:hypothetical protein
MLPRVVRAELVQDFRIRLTFSDGAVGVIDFHDLIVGRGGVFQPLGDPSTFASFRVDDDAGTLVWPNGIDFCPVTLHARMTGRAIVAA